MTCNRKRGRRETRRTVTDPLVVWPPRGGIAFASASWRRLLSPGSQALRNPPRVVQPVTAPQDTAAGVVGFHDAPAPVEADDANPGAFDELADVGHKALDHAGLGRLPGTLLDGVEDCPGNV